MSYLSDNSRKTLIEIILILSIFISLISAVRGTLQESIDVNGMIIYPCIFMISLIVYCLPYKFIVWIFCSFVLFYFTIFISTFYLLGYSDDKANFTLLTVGSNVMAFAFGLLLFTWSKVRILKPLSVGVIVFLASRASFAALMLASVWKYFLRVVVTLSVVGLIFVQFKDIIIQFVPMLRWFFRVGLSKRDQKLFDFISFMKDDFTVANIFFGYGGGSYGTIVYQSKGIYAHNFVSQCIVEFGVLFTLLQLIFIIIASGTNYGLMIFIIVVSLVETTYENYITLLFINITLIYNYNYMRKKFKQLPSNRR